MNLSSSTTAKSIGHSSWTDGRPRGLILSRNFWIHSLKPTDTIENIQKMETTSVLQPTATEESILLLNAMTNPAPCCWPLISTQHHS
ncbi:unnamed protein product [Acanthoscelides obtectus]|uniref:Uncharacterized protein n=1 Tax=Acanthoscelides obtectus TaxID=200917 RepID=A0A9P0LN31_ACAOB|nr:unnamed protein product [Acanthoscelides obtectus]CAK1660839.1 hypothetical protein AOBTE_LOCUS22291 [Acanthoscelides obtectus]